MRKLNEIIMHCSATREGQHHTVDQFRSWHVKGRGWNDIGYHFVIYLDGSRHVGRPLSKIGAHVAGRNTGTIGICYVGGVAKDGKTPKDTRTPAQKRAIEALIKELMSEYPSITKVSGHNQYAAKACPSFNAQEEYRHLTGSAREVAVNVVDERIRYLQKLLALAGHYTGQHDGIMGPKTRKGLKNYQREHGLEQTSRFDDKTVARLRMIERPVTVQEKAVIKDAAALGRKSKTKLASEIGTGALSFGTVAENADQISGTFHSVKPVLDYLPEWLGPVLIVLGVAAFAYIWWDRNRKENDAEAIL